MGIKITITTEDGILLDQFKVCDWRDDNDDAEDTECVGSHASESLLAERIRRALEQHTASQEAK